MKGREVLMLVKVYRQIIKGLLRQYNHLVLRDLVRVISRSGTQV